MIRGEGVFDTIRMFQEENLDVRTVTLGLNLDDCSSPTLAQLGAKIRARIAHRAGDLVRATRAVEQRYGIPVVNKRLAVSPIATVAAGHNCDGLVQLATVLDRAAAEVGVDLIGGFGALAHKGLTPTARALIEALPEALSGTHRVCAGISVASTRPASTWTRCCNSATPSAPWPKPTPPTTVSPAPSWWCSPTCRRTTRSWPAPPTALARPTR